MKTIKYLLIAVLAFFLAGSCDENYIDPIRKVDQGEDNAAPTLNIKFPLEGSQVKSEDEVATVKISFEAMDDIELQEVSVTLDNAELVKYNEFKDYRQVSQEYEYTNLTEGAHTLTIVATDKSGKSTTQTVNFEKSTPYVPIYPGEIFYMPFEGDYTEQVSNIPATVVGSPSIADGKVGKAYAGVVDSYITFPADTLTKTKEISAVFWMKVYISPEPLKSRAGILTVSAEDKENAKYPGVQNFRGSGFRFFREADAALQRVKLNVGIGGILETWNDGGTVDPVLAEWVHIAFTVSTTSTKIYINGVKTLKPDGVLTAPIDWNGCDLLTIMSGVPRFTEWEHFSDLSLMDELRFFNKELTVEEINTIMNAENQ